MTFLAGPEIAGKQLQLLKDVVPAASRVAVLVNPANASHAAFLQAVQAAARSLDVQLQLVQAQTSGQIEGALAAIAKERAAAMLVLTDAMFLGQHRRLAELATKSRLPAMFGQREFVDAGGLVAYGPSLPDMFRRAATHVDKILKGAKPADLPVERPAKFELVINLKTAKALGVAIPQTVLLRADEVIE
jgi:putative tryptophan/tyrosine transport system substrate-binding protein